MAVKWVHQIAAPATTADSMIQAARSALVVALARPTNGRRGAGDADERGDKYQPKIVLIG